ncbi:hypothetical protein GCM10010393_45690 [Streptomyces gobitricini]|uniref:Uncharacterized protein n=1 Tax=Streptomyces gobitricini TaxID=68211 RepID=A0ABN3MSA7_9ACTN
MLAQRVVAVAALAGAGWGSARLGQAATRGEVRTVREDSELRVLPARGHRCAPPSGVLVIGAAVPPRAAPATGRPGPRTGAPADAAVAQWRGDPAAPAGPARAHRPYLTGALVAPGRAVRPRAGPPGALPGLPAAAP